MLNKTTQFLKEVGIELKKCDWPVKRDRTLPFMDRIRDLWDSTVVVMVCMVLLASFIGGVDFLLSKMVQIILK